MCKKGLIYFVWRFCQYSVSHQHQKIYLSNSSIQYLKPYHYLYPREKKETHYSKTQVSKIVIKKIPEQESPNKLKTLEDGNTLSSKKHVAANDG